MIRELEKKPISLFGFKAYHVTISNSFRSDWSAFNKTWKYGMIGPSPVDFEAEFLLDRHNIYEIHCMFDRIARLGGFTISSLGDTQICQCCNYQMRAGALTCHRCGAPYTSTVENSQYRRVGRGYVTEITHNEELDLNYYQLYRARLSFSMDDLMLIDGDIYKTLNGWCTTHIEDGWICWYCKSVNELGRTECKYCGGGRLPFSDLERIAQKCLYCGTKLTSGAVCAGCGSAQNGYSVWPPRYDW